MTAPLRVSVVTEGDPDRISGGFLYHRWLRDLADRHHATIRTVSLWSRGFPWALLDGWRALRRAADADVVVIDSLASVSVAPWLAVLRRSVPVIGSVHQVPGGVGHSRWRAFVQARLDTFVWRRCTALFVPSRGLADDLVEAGVDRDRIAVIAPGHELPEPDPETPRPDLRGAAHCAVIAVANWMPNKGVLALVRAVASLPPDLVRLHLVGDTTIDRLYTRRVLTAIRELGVADRVVVHGRVEPSALRTLYDAADVFAFASHRESYGIVFGEAMARGLPIVAWPSGNLSRMVDDGVEGLIVDHGDVPALALALAGLASDPERRERLAAAAFRRARGLPRWSDAARAFFSLCRWAVAADRASADLEQIRPGTSPSAARVAPRVKSSPVAPETLG